MQFRSFYALLLASAVTGAAHADIVNLKCVQTGADEYKLTYTLTGNTKSVAVLASAEANSVPTSAPLRTVSENTVTIHAGKPHERMYFYLKADTGEVSEVSIRHLPLEGTPNFRDLGGYKTTDGRTVRWGLLYRSGVLTYLTPEDYKYLSGLGIRVVCDFRTKEEAQAAAETWIPGSSAEQISLPIGAKPKEPGQEPTVRQSFDPNATPEQMRKAMSSTYGTFAFYSAEQYAAVFQQLKNDHLPLLYHCTAGKDRTGVFSALVLLTLGVPEETVLADYALTNEYLGANMNSEAMKKMMAASGASNLNAMKNLTPEQQKVMMVADPEYLRATLRQINEKYGSFDNYRRTVLHVSDADAAQLRERLTER
ncbi:tyrosine-protein phosphatase [Terriglobus sp. ADX1]|uniref:tyrosine-protein phosphatase n=1 Tax=Terriglobus sp. ADX1 TaxID=2794063 RepID=UPI002FE6512B